MDTGSVTILVFHYPESGSVDLRWNDDGCQTLDNGRLGARQAGSPSFDAFQTAVTAAVEPG